MTSRDWGLAAAAIALIADQGSKILMLYGFGFINMGPGEAIGVLPFFNLVMVWNPGVSYGLFPANSKLAAIAIVAVAALIVAGLLFWLWRITDTVLAVGLGLIIGGAVGNNLIDRLIYGRVADFFHFYGFGYDWYIFNVADIAITLGAIVIIYDVFRADHPATT